MKNIQVCKSCGTENPLYVSSCKKCNTILRDKIANIDLWSEIGRLIENPSSAFKTIIQSEHKNFVMTIILFVVAKFSIDSTFFSMLLSKATYTDFSIFSNVIFLITFLLAILFSYSFLIKIITQNSSAKTRLKDNLAVLVYSLIPHAFALCIIFPIEVAVFGGNVFSTNPSPFLLKPTLAYIFSGFEILVFVWSIFLASAGLYSQTRSKLFGFGTGVIFNIIILCGLYFLSLI
jgi:hypothetical protein